MALITRIDLPFSQLFGYTDCVSFDCVSFDIYKVIVKPFLRQLLKNLKNSTSKSFGCSEEFNEKQQILGKKIS